MNQLDFNGRHAVITGGATGLGYAIAQRLLASGGSVSLWDRDAALASRRRSELGPRPHAVAVDVSDQPRWQAAVQGHAGPCRPRRCAGQQRRHHRPQWQGVGLPGGRLAFKVIGYQPQRAVHLLPRVVPHMRERNYGRIVNIASVAGKDGNPNASAYSASKAAVMALTKSLGKELADTGVRVNCVTPAAVKTAIFDQMTPEHIQFMLSKIPMGRFGTPEEVAAMVGWLCTEDCSFSTGAVFDLSGGRSTY
jgi:NAD(P)-dependent dehydrogenase (short-subunit alcohol dehydrogenase family)